MKLTAYKRIRYGGKAVEKGGVFEVKAADIRILVALGHKPYSEPPKVRAPVTKTIVRSLEAEQTVSNMPSVDVVSNVPESEVPKRAYKRRDMVSE